MPETVVYTKSFCPFCVWAKALLERHGVPYEEIGVTGRPELLQEMVERSGGRLTAPQIFVGNVHLGGYEELAALDAAGGLAPLLRSEARSDDQEEEPLSDHHHRLIILGSGPAGLTAAIYAARANLEPVVVEGREFGGQLYTTTDVENFPGFPEGIQGPELIDRMKAQAERFGAHFVRGHTSAVHLADRPFRVALEDAPERTCDALIVATGAVPRELGVPNERELRGFGVSTCATCDAAFFREKEVAVVGGGDSAIEEGLFLTKFASKVTVIHRRDELRASKILQDRARANPKIEFAWNSTVRKFIGSRETGLTGLEIADTVSDASREMPVDGCFVAIGHDPNSALLRDSGVGLDDLGYVTGNGEHLPYTALDGVFVAGDVHDHVYRQAITAAGYGCRAALAAERWLEARASVPEEDPGA